MVLSLVVLVVAVLVPFAAGGEACARCGARTSSTAAACRRVRRGPLRRCRDHGRQLLVRGDRVALGWWAVAGIGLTVWLATGLGQALVQSITAGATSTATGSLATDGEGLSASGNVATRLGKPITGIGPARASLIAKGLVYAPEHGRLGYTVPGMAAFIDRQLV